MTYEAFDLLNFCFLLQFLCLFWPMMSNVLYEILTSFPNIWQVVPQLSCPIALFTYYNPILKRGTEKFMATVRDTGVHGNL